MVFFIDSHKHYLSTRIDNQMDGRPTLMRLSNTLVAAPHSQRIGFQVVRMKGGTIDDLATAWTCEPLTFSHPHKPWTTIRSLLA